LGHSKSAGREFPTTLGSVVTPRIRAVGLFLLVLIVWTAVVIRWGDTSGIWVPDDPEDGGAVIAAQYGGTMIALIVWLVGFAVIAPFAVWLNAWIERKRR
jgi:hypothetical protein